MTAIALLGTGGMGAPIAHRLLAAGHPLTVWNRTAARTTTLVAAGARGADSPAAAVEGADVVITMLTDTTAVEAVLFGPAGAASALASGTVLVEMSTIGPAAVAALARRLPSGIELVDAPVAGSVTAATQGELTVLAGGTKATVDGLRPVLEELGTVRYCGGSGTGAATKLVLITATVTGLAALADTLKVATAVRVDQDIALDALAAGPLGGAVSRARATGSSFSVALAAKDMGLALSAVNASPTSDGPRDRVPVIRAATTLLALAPDQTTDIATILTNDSPRG